VLISLLGYSQENLAISKVKFEGNIHFANSRLREEITMQPSSWIREKIFGKEPVYYGKQLYEDDIKRLTIFFSEAGIFEC